MKSKCLVILFSVLIASCGDNTIIIACGGGNVDNKYYYVPRSVKSIGCHENNLRYQNNKDEWIDVQPFA